VTGPVGAGLHGLAVAALVSGALLAPVNMPGPATRALLLNFAPPPPPPVRSGADLASSMPVAPEAIATPTDVVPLLRTIPDAILSPTFELAALAEGFVDGDLDGLPDGLTGGVLGGVPGGIPGGVIGGTGDLPSFPKPDVGPSPIRMPQPSYTQKAIRDNVSGSVVLRVVIDERGAVRVLKVLRSVPELDEEAIRVVESSWRFHPATRNGRPVAALSDLIVRFSLY
jgi:protein TonB